MSVISIPLLPDKINVNSGLLDAVADIVLQDDRAAVRTRILSLSSGWRAAFLEAGEGAGDSGEPARVVHTPTSA